MVCYHTEYLHVEYHSAKSVLIGQWYGKCSSLQYRQALIYFIRLCKQLHVHHLIMDGRLLPAISQEDSTWTNNTFLRAFNQLPLRRFAFLNPFDVQAEHQQQESLLQDIAFETRSFEDLTSAYDWLTANEAAA